MCCEDVKIAMDTRSAENVVSFAASAQQQIIGANLKRTALLLSNPSAGSIRYSTIPGATALQGILVNQNNNSIFLNIWDHGDIVRDAWFGFSSAALTINVIETSLGATCDDKP